MHPVGTGSIVQMYFKCDVPQNSQCMLIVEDNTESQCLLAMYVCPLARSLSLCSLPCSTFASPLVG